MPRAGFKPLPRTCSCARVWPSLLQLQPLSAPPVPNEDGWFASESPALPPSTYSNREEQVSQGPNDLAVCAWHGVSSMFTLNCFPWSLALFSPASHCPVPQFCIPTSLPSVNVSFLPARQAHFVFFPSQFFLPGLIFTPLHLIQPPPFPSFLPFLSLSSFPRFLQDEDDLPLPAEPPISLRSPGLWCKGRCSLVWTISSGEISS